MGRQTLRAYWWRSVANFGDALAPLLLEHFADVKVIWEPVETTEIVSVGSVLEHIKPDWKGYILGSGKHKEHTKLTIGSEAKILALRGPLTAKFFTGSYALGDPGILANELVGPQKKLWDIGIVPHWRDTTLAGSFPKLIPKQYSCKVIDVRESPLEVLRQIGSCGKIVTSSLHGMIVADAFGLPRRVEYCPELSKPSEGGDFKFRDYSESIHAPFEFGKLQTATRVRVEDLQFSIYDAYRELSSIVKKRAK